MEPVPVDQFEQLVADALDDLPDDFLDAMDNVVVVVDDDHPEGLLGLYEGIPHTERDEYGGFSLPDRITLYRVPLCRFVDTDEQLFEEIFVTLVHELAHHVGIDDDRLHELGWD